MPHLLTVNEHHLGVPAGGSSLDWLVPGPLEVSTLQGHIQEVQSRLQEQDDEMCPEQRLQYSVSRPLLSLPPTKIMHDPRRILASRRLLPMKLGEYMTKAALLVGPLHKVVRSGSHLKSAAVEVSHQQALQCKIFSCNQSNLASVKHSKMRSHGKPK